MQGSQSPSHGLTLFVDPYTKSVREGQQLAKRAEELGFESIWTTEWPNRNALVRAAAVATSTERVTVGTGVALTFVRSPVSTATAAADLDQLAEGRFVLGLGTATKHMNRAWYGVDAPEKPLSQMKEAIEVIRQVWDSDGTEDLVFNGEFYRLRIPAGQNLREMHHPSIPIYIAAVNPRLARVAGQIADGLLGHPVYPRQYLENVVVPAVARGLDESNRRPDSFNLTCLVFAYINEEAGRARQDAKLQIGYYFTTKTYHPLLDRYGWQTEKEAIRRAFEARDWNALSDAVSDEMLDSIALAGTPSEVRDQIKRYKGLCDRVVFYCPSFGLEEPRGDEYLENLLACFGTSQH